MSIILCGMPGCGKSTIGRNFAAKASLEFLDTDRLIENDFNQGTDQLNCRDIYTKIGDRAFRDLEKKMILQIPKNPEKVIAIGGGTLQDPANASHLKSIGIMIYLKGKNETLYKRAIENGIPAFLDKKNPWDSYQKLAHTRIPIYETTVDVILDIEEKSIDQIINLVSSSRRKYGK